MKAADAGLHAAGHEFAGQIHGAGKLIGLHPYERHHSQATGLLHHLRELVHPDAGIGLIQRRHFDCDVIPQHATLHTVQCQSIDRGHGVGWHRGTGPLDHVAVVIVMGRFDQDQMKLFCCGV